MTLRIRLSPKTKIPSSTAGKNHILILAHMGCNRALSRYYTQCNESVSIRVATCIFIKLKALSCTFDTSCSRAVTFHIQSSPVEQCESNDPRCALSTVLGCTPSPSARHSRPACVCAFRARLISTHHPRCAGQWKNVKLKKPCRYLAHSGAVLKSCQKDLWMIYQRKTPAKAENQTLLPC